MDCVESRCIKIVSLWRRFKKRKASDSSLIRWTQMIASLSLELISSGLRILPNHSVIAYSWFVLNIYSVLWGGSFQFCLCSLPSRSSTAQLTMEKANNGSFPSPGALKYTPLLPCFQHESCSLTDPCTLSTLSTILYISLFLNCWISIETQELRSTDETEFRLLSNHILHFKYKHAPGWNRYNLEKK